MGLFNKIKDMFFEEEEDNDVQVNDNRIAKKIEISKAKTKDPEPIVEEKEEFVEPIIEDFEEPEIDEEEELTKVRKPVIFDDEDFIEDFVSEQETKEHVLYGGVTTKKEPVIDKKKFAPSPIISPVYGVLSKNYQKEDFEESKKDLDHLFVEERKKKITFDSVRQKAYGDLTDEIEQIMEKPAAESKKLLYDMEAEEKGPAVEAVTMGDAEEYFKDLGLEYNVDYIDVTKTHRTRSEKNKDLTEKVTTPIEETDEEKNLYDLIDMMYENKEE